MIKTFLIYTILDLCIDTFFDNVTRNLTPPDPERQPTVYEIHIALQRCLYRRTGYINDSIESVADLVDDVMNELNCSMKFYEYVFTQIATVMKKAFRDVAIKFPEAVKSVPEINKPIGFDLLE